MTTTTVVQRTDLLYRATKTPQLVQVPRLKFLCVDGHGDPNTSPAYVNTVQALYSVSYAAKFAVQKAGGTAVKVSALEGLWWAEDLSTFSAADKSEWDWTMMIRQHDTLTGDLVERLAEQVALKKSMPAARLISFEEGAAAQVLHVGPYATEAPTIAPPRIHPTAGVHLRRPSPQTPRDLPRRPASVGSREPAHHHQAAVRREVTRGVGRTTPTLARLVHPVTTID